MIQIYARRSPNEHTEPLASPQPKPVAASTSQSAGPSTPAGSTTAAPSTPSAPQAAPNTSSTSIPPQTPSTPTPNPNPSSALSSAETPAPAVGSNEPASGDANSSFISGSALQTAIAGMMDMGFERDQVMRCLRASFNNPDRAVEYLMTVSCG